MVDGFYIANVFMKSNLLLLLMVLLVSYKDESVEQVIDQG